MLDFLLPKFHFFAFARFGLLGLAGPIAVGTTLGHSAMKSRRGMVNMPPVVCAAHVATIVGHGLQIEAGAQALGGDRVGNSAAIAPVKNAMAWHIGRLAPEKTEAFEVAKKVIQFGFPVVVL